MKTESRQGRYGLALVAAVGVMGVAGLALVVAPEVQRARDHDAMPSVDSFELPLAPAAALQILNVSGRVAVSTCDGEQAMFTITREAMHRGGVMSWILRPFDHGPGRDAASEKPVVRSTAGGLQVSTLGLGSSGGEAINYSIDVRLPRGRSVQASSENGPITISGVEGEVSAAAGNGDVRCEAVTGKVTAAARNGNVYCRFVSGGIDAKSANGAVEIDRACANGAFPIRVWTANGPIRFRAADLAMNLHAQTENGRVSDGLATAAAGHSQTLQTLDLRAGNGEAEVDLHALNGDIYVDAI